MDACFQALGLGAFNKVIQCLNFPTEIRFYVELMVIAYSTAIRLGASLLWLAVGDKYTL